MGVKRTVQQPELDGETHSICHYYSITVSCKKMSFIICSDEANALLSPFFLSQLRRNKIRLNWAPIDLSIASFCLGVFVDKERERNFQRLWVVVRRGRRPPDWPVCDPISKEKESQQTAFSFTLPLPWKKCFFFLPLCWWWWLFLLMIWWPRPYVTDRLFLP